jgi:UDP-3-O-[3-hydroxymyristoyl] N-acetylglucosamine deacetylase
MIQRRTLRREVRLSGRGLHSGVPVEVLIAPSDKGIQFRHQSHTVQALPENVTDTRRCTRLGEISTVEHLMSAFAGLEITDADVSLSSPELPALDGSAAEYVAALREAETENLPDQAMGELFSRVFIQQEAIKIAISKGTGHWSYRYETGERWPHEMSFECEDVVAHYADEIASARTFALAEEVPHVLQAGLGQGLDENSVLILGQSGYEGPARFPDEPARHKLLDLIGDLYLSGVPVKHLNVSAEKSGHASNVKAAASLREALFNH